MRQVNWMLAVVIAGAAVCGGEDLRRIERAGTRLEVDVASGAWALTDLRGAVRWPSGGMARAGVAGPFTVRPGGADAALRLENAGGEAITFMVGDSGALALHWQGGGDLRVLDDALWTGEDEGGYVIVPCREGLLIPAGGGEPFRRTFGTSEYEGCHMNMLGLAKGGATLVVTWDDAYVFPEVRREAAAASAPGRRLTAAFTLRASARSLVLHPLGKGDWNTIAAAYRGMADAAGRAVTLRDKIRRNPDAALLVGASNFKLWTCLARRMNEESTAEESVRVRWTFDEAARIAEHLKHDLSIDRCLFMIGGWTEGGYDCRHPDNLPANPECGGNEALANAVARIQALGYVGCLHDNYQDMYRDASSWNPADIEKRPDGTLITGGRWLGGRAYMVCAPRQVALAMRPQNLPGIRKLFPVKSYFIDTTYAAGPRECHDPAHPIGRNEDIAHKQVLSDRAREIFGLFGSECGREWALAHSEFFEGLVGVSGRHYHSLDPAALGARVIPFWEMVFHDCQICWGKYGYTGEAAAAYVAHHVLCARPLHYHSVPDGLYWKRRADAGAVDVTPRVTDVEPLGERSFRIRYAWDVRGDVTEPWRVFVHFGTAADILFQDDHLPEPPTSAWRAGATISIGPRTVSVPASLAADSVNVYVGLFGPADAGSRAALPGADGQRRVLAGRLRLKPSIAFEAAVRDDGAPNSGMYARSDQGWADGMHPLDVFIKNTHEVLGPLHAETAFLRLERLELPPEGEGVYRAVYGSGAAAVRVAVNLGARTADVATRHGGTAVLPPWGFVVEGPRFAAFCALQWGGRAYPGGALFTLRADGDAADLASAPRVRVFHGFGEPRITWRGTTHTVVREGVIGP